MFLVRVNLTLNFLLLSKLWPQISKYPEKSIFRPRSQWASTLFQRWGIFEFKLLRWSTIIQRWINVEVSPLKLKPYLNVNSTLKTQPILKVEGTYNFSTLNQCLKNETFSILKPTPLDLFFLSWKHKIRVFFYNSYLLKYIWILFKS